MLDVVDAIRVLLGVPFFVVGILIRFLGISVAFVGVLIGYGLTGVKEFWTEEI